MAHILWHWASLRANVSAHNVPFNASVNIEDKKDKEGGPQCVYTCARVCKGSIKKRDLQ